MFCLSSFRVFSCVLYVVCWVLFVVCCMCLVFGVWHCVFEVCRLLFVVCCALYVVGCPLCLACCLVFGVCRLPAVVFYVCVDCWFVLFGCSWDVVCLMFVVRWCGLFVVVC